MECAFRFCADLELQRNPERAKRKQHKSAACNHHALVRTLPVALDKIRIRVAASARKQNQRDNRKRYGQKRHRTDRKANRCRR